MLQRARVRWSGAEWQGLRSLYGRFQALAEGEQSKQSAPQELSSAGRSVRLRHKLVHRLAACAALELLPSNAACKKDTWCTEGIYSEHGAAWGSMGQYEAASL